MPVEVQVLSSAYHKRVYGLLRAESKFRRLKGHRGMPTLLKALERIVRKEPPGTERDVA
jgi:hypothetical protein